MKKTILLLLFSAISLGQVRTLADKIKNIRNIASPRELQALLVEFESRFTSGGVTGGTSSAIFLPFNSTIPFTGFPTVMQTKQINVPLTISPNTVGAVPGASAVLRLVADGVNSNAPTFNNFKQITGSSGWDNRAGKINIINIQYDGVDYLFSITQTILNATLDLQAPAFVSSAVNATGTVVTLSFNEDLLATSVPISSNFSGATVTSATVLNKIVTLNLNPAIASGATANIVYTGSTIQDLATNQSPNFTTSVTVAATQLQIPVNLDSRQTNLSQVLVGTYKKILTGGWTSGISTSLNFVGDKTFEVSDASLSSTQAIIGLDTRTVADVNLIYQNLKLGISYYSGSYKAFIDGNQTNLIGYVAGDRMRIIRTLGVLKAQYKRGAADWTDLFTFPSTATTTGALSTCMFLDDLNSQLSLVIY